MQRKWCTFELLDHFIEDNSILWFFIVNAQNGCLCCIVFSFILDISSHDARIGTFEPSIILITSVTAIYNGMTRE